MTNRTWIKVYCDKWLSGTLREERPDVRSVWIDLLVLAGSGQYGDIGEVKLQNGIGYTDSQIAAIICISKALWMKAKKRFLESQRIEILPKGAIRIINWKKYQSVFSASEKGPTSGNLKGYHPG